MTLGELRSRMTDVELIGWSAYLNVRAEQERKAYEAAKRRR